MKIVYTENPLCTRVELEPHESKELWYLIKVEEMVEMLYDAHFHLQDDKWHDLDKARYAVEPTYYLGNEDDENNVSKLDQRVNELHAHFMEELVSTHAGDCTCFCASCSKCHVEEMLGIRTVENLGKHAGHYMHGLFHKEGIDTCAKAIADLRANESLSDTGKKVLEWLVNYQTTKLDPQNQSLQTTKE